MPDEVYVIAAVVVHVLLVCALAQLIARVAPGYDPRASVARDLLEASLEIAAGALFSHWLRPVSASFAPRRLAAAIPFSVVEAVVLTMSQEAMRCKLARVQETVGRWGAAASGIAASVAGRRP